MLHVFLLYTLRLSVDRHARCPLLAAHGHAGVVHDVHPREPRRDDTQLPPLVLQQLAIHPMGRPEARHRHLHTSRIPSLTTNLPSKSCPRQRGRENSQSRKAARSVRD
eukprot:3194247-Pyramimonas_sp.AAC.1